MDSGDTRGRWPAVVVLAAEGVGTEMEREKPFFAYAKHVSDIHRRGAKQMVAKCLLYFGIVVFLRKFSRESSETKIQEDEEKMPFRSCFMHRNGPIPSADCIHI